MYHIGGLNLKQVKLYVKNTLKSLIANFFCFIEHCYFFL